VKINGYKQRWIIWGAFSIFIAVVSLIPSRSFEDIPTFSYEDLLVHFSIYAIHASLLLWAWKPHHKKTKSDIITIIAICAAYGFLMEILQPILQPNDRHFSILDILANTAGATIISISLTKHRNLITKGKTNDY